MQLSWSPKRSTSSPHLRPRGERKGHANCARVASRAPDPRSSAIRRSPHAVDACAVVCLASIWFPGALDALASLVLSSQRQHHHQPHRRIRQQLLQQQRQDHQLQQTMLFIHLSLLRRPLPSRHMSSLLQPSQTSGALSCLRTLPPQPIYHHYSR